MMQANALKQTKKQNASVQQRITLFTIHALHISELCSTVELCVSKGKRNKTVTINLV